MNRIFRNMHIVARGDFQSYWLIGDKPFGDSGCSRSWRHGVPYPIFAENFKQKFETAEKFIESIVNLMKETDDFPIPMDDPRNLAIGYLFPKTRNHIVLKLFGLTRSNSPQATAIYQARQTAEGIENMRMELMQIRENNRKAARGIKAP